MRKVTIVLTLVCASLILVGVLPSRSSAQIDPGTIAGMWLFDEGAGDVAKDSSGNNNDGAVLGPEWVDGKIGKALKFDGADDYVDCGNGQSLNLIDQMTVVAWFSHPTGTEGYFLIKNTPDDSIRQWGFLDYVSSNRTSLFCNTDTGSREEIQWDGEIFDDDKWHHFAMTINNPDAELFIDGVSKGTQQLGGNIVSADTSVWIGRRKPGNFAYTGMLDEIAIFSAVLSGDDINDIMTVGLGGAVTAVSAADKLSTTWAAIKTQR